MSQFVLLPWEHAFSGASSKPHATARLSVGGKTRNFVLKIHEGTLYFKEPARSATFAVLESFEAHRPNDSIGLISKWQQHVAQNNFGAFISKRDYFPKLPVRGQILMVIKSDGSGWMKEHFDPEWFLLPEEGRAELDVWNDKEVEVHGRQRLPIVQRQLINRALPPQTIESELPRWKAESGDTITQILIAAARLFVPPSSYWSDLDHRLLKIKSHSAFSKGDIEGAWLKHALHSEKFKQVWDILEPRVQFVGVHWNEGGEQLEQYGRSRNDKLFQAGMEKWGHLWRGNWGPQRASLRIELPDTTDQNAHEKMDAALTLREWLVGKMPAQEIEKLFGKSI